MASLIGALGFAGHVQAALQVQVTAAPNFVVDSNVESPSTYGPKAAYIAATFSNTGTNALTNVVAYIGNYVDGTNDTPGLYPTNKTASLTGPLPNGMFALTHEGGSSGLGDATRNIGTLAPGQSVTVYWLVSYPTKDVNGKAVWGPSVKPDDDLQLQYDVWSTALEAGVKNTSVQTQTVTMRNEISAMANKIFPNTANKVPAEYQALLGQYAPVWTNVASDGTPGSLISSSGVWYDLGNVGQGFDANGDLVPDKDLWMQPVGDPTLFDAGAFRLVHTYVLIIVKLKTGGEQIITAEDQLYFSGLPENNGAVGYVRYDFRVLKPSATSSLTPYQEVASGYDNEKFNGDYGASIGGPLSSGVSAVNLNKSADRATASPADTIRYSLTFTNTGTVAVGDPGGGLPLVIQDRIPTGAVYVAGSAASSNTLPAGVTSYSILYSTNNGVGWLTAEPAAATNVTDIQWWLSDALPTNAGGTVRFSAKVASPYPPISPMLVNTGALAFGTATPFATSTAQTLITGTNRLGDTVFADDGSGGGTLGNALQDGTETGISNVTVRLYWDANTNGVLDSSDTLLATTVTATNGIYAFTNLPDGKYLAVVDSTNAFLPLGYTPSTPVSYGVDLDSARTNASSVVYLAADFGFAPAFAVSKRLTSSTPMYEGRYVTYSIDLTNRLPGDGTGVGTLVTYVAWATNATAAAAEWMTYTNVFGSPDGRYSSNNVSGASKLLTVNNFSVGVQQGNVSNVSLVLPILLVTPNDNDDTFVVTVNRLSPAQQLFTRSYMITSLVTGTLVVPMTGSVAWTWADFATNYTVSLSAEKNTGNATGGFWLDAVGFRVQSDQTNTGASATTTLDPIPLTDTYNASFFQYVSASPVPTTVSTNGAYPNTVGSLYWSDLGPLYPGGGKTVTITLKALEPFNVTSNTAVAVTNLASATNATFIGGNRANPSTSQATNTLNPAGSIGDLIWRDLSPFGAYSTNEPGIPNVKVVLTPPSGVDAGAGVGVPITNTTDSTGRYLFEGLTVFTNYTITVLTNTLPSGAFTNTFDEDGNSNNVMIVTNMNPTATNGADKHLTADFGYRLGNTIDGTIWNDLNRDGASTPGTGEPWLSGVTVYLYSSTNLATPIATNQTSSTGYFSFTGNYTGSYVVVVATNTGALTNGTWVQTYDSDVGTSGLSNRVAVTVANGTARADFSYYLGGTFSIGDTLFYDWNSNGVQNVTTEEGIPNITVYLYQDANSNGVVDIGTDGLIAVTATDTGGTYLFTNQPPGNYLVLVDQGDPQFPPRSLVTADPYGAKDGLSALVITNASNTNQDFGYWPYGSGSIGDTVWLDANADGTQSGASERGLSNILVSLFVDMNGDGTYVLRSTALTDATGKYLFSSLPDGAYRVVVDSTSTNLPKDAFGYTAVATTATNVLATISGGNSVLTADFGFAPLGAVGDTIFWDMNANGNQDWTEAGITNVTVKLYRDANSNGVYDVGETLVATQTTTTNGNYLFAGLSQGRYVVLVDTNSAPLTRAVLTADPNNDGRPYGDPLATNYDNQVGVTLQPGGNFMGADFGYQPPGVIGDLVWIDTNTNGVRDAGELGIPYVTVLLYSNTTVIASNQTDADGYYSFGNLADGTYRVGVITNNASFPSGLAQVYDPDRTNDSVAVGIVLSGGHITTVGGSTWTNGDLGIDFGYKYAGNNVLSGTVGMDATPYDGLLGTGASGVSSNEAPFANVSVYIYLWNDGNGNSNVNAGETTLIGTTTTSTNGDYSFTGLPSGASSNRYIVSLSAPMADLALTTTNGSTPALWIKPTTNADGSVVSAYQVVTIAAVTTNIDFAFKSAIALDFGDLPSSYSTLLSDVPDGARHVVRLVPDLYLGASVDTELNGQPSVTATGDDSNGTTNDENGVVPVGIWQNATNGGTVRVTVGAGSGWLCGYIDFNKNGKFIDTNELCISRAVTTGTYTLVFAVPAGSILTNATQLYARFRLFPSQPLIPALAYSGAADDGEVEDYRFDFGTIGDTVFRDWNGNGTQDSGEEGLPGVTVALTYYGADGLLGTGDDVVTNVVTDANGNYLFTGLQAGKYSVDVPSPGSGGVPSGYTLTTGNDPLVVTLTANQQFQTADFGYRPGGTGSIGDQVFKDANTNGVFDVGEVGVSNITISLYRDANGNGVIDAGDVLAATTTSASNGSYSFASLATGFSYIVDLDQTDADMALQFPVGYQNTTPEPAAVTNLTGTYTNADFGFFQYQPCTIGDLVWFDNNGNGTYDAGETGLSNVTVRLYASDGTNLIASTVTATNGAYSFTNRPPGTYVVKVDTTDPDIPNYLLASVSQYSPVVMVSGQTDNTRDFPFVRLLNKAVDVSQASPPVNLTYTLTPGYAGPDLLVNATVSDLIPTGTTFVSAGQNGTNSPLGTVTWQLGTNTAAIDGAKTLTNIVTIAQRGAATTGTTSTTSLTINSPAGVVSGDVMIVTIDQMNDISQAATNAGWTLVASAQIEPGGQHHLGSVLYKVAGTNEPSSYTFTLASAVNSAAGAIVAFSGVDSSAGTPFDVVPGGISVQNTSSVSASNVTTVTDYAAIVMLAMSKAAVTFSGWTTATSPGTLTELFDYNNGNPAVGAAWAIKTNAGSTGLGSATLSAGKQSGGLIVALRAASSTYNVTNSLSVNQRLVGSNTQVTVTLTCSANADAGTVTPGALTVTGVNAATGSFGAASPLSATLSNSTVTFTYTGTVFSGSSPGSVTLRVTPTDSHGTWPTATSPSVLVTPPLTFTVNVPNPYNSGAVTNVASLKTNGSVMVYSPPAVTIINGAISGNVWIDANGNGVTNAPDTNGISGVTIGLYDTNGVLLATTTTSATGAYTFTNLPAGSYTVRETDPSGYVSTGNRDGAGTNNTLAVTVTSGQISGGNYFLDTAPTSISGGVFVDLNGNGVVEGGDTNPIDGVTITLLDATNGVVATTLTAADGSYVFTNLMPGSYTVVETDAADYYSTLPANNQRAVTLASGTPSTGNNFYDTQYATITGAVLEDMNANGTNDVSDTNGIAGVTVGLYTTNGVLVATTTTDSGGVYLFTGVTPGSYVVRETDLAGYFSTGDSDGAATTNQIAVTVVSGQYVSGQEFYDSRPVTIGDQVFFDANADNLYNLGDHPLSNVLVYLYASDGTTLLASTNSAADGTYSFTGLPPGTYVVKVNTSDPDLPSYVSASIAAYDPVVMVSGQTDNARDFPFGAYLQKSVDKSVAAPGQTLTFKISPTYTAANLLQNATVSDTVPTGTTFASFGQVGAVTNLPPLTWTLGSNSAPVNGSSLSHYSNTVSIVASADSWLNANFKTTNYGTNGTMRVDSNAGGIGNGRPVVRFSLSSVPTNATVTAATLQMTVVSNAAGSRTIGVYDLTSSWVENQVTWNVRSSGNNWGTAGGDYPGVGTALASTTIDANGAYTWSSAGFLAEVRNWVTNSARNYGVIVGDEGAGGITKDFATREYTNTSARPVLTVTYTNAPINTTTRLSVDKLLVTDPDPSNGTVGVNLLVTMTVGSDVALTNVAPPTLTATKALGTAATATLLSGTPANVNIAAGGTATFTWTYRLDVDSSSSNWKEYIKFSGTPTHAIATFGSATSPGVILTQPLSFTATINTPAGVSNVINQATIKTNGSTLYVSNPTDTSLNPATIGDFAWVDLNGNGQQDVGEPGLSNVTVRLYDITDSLMASTTTSTNGYYTFTNVAPGTYSVSFTPPAGYLFTTSKVGNAATDSDPLSGTNVTAQFAVLAGQTNNAIDAGFYQLGSIAGSVLVDINANGVKDAGDTNGINGVTVGLYTTNGVLLATTRTTANGSYVFTNLPPGSYIVTETDPARYWSTGDSSAPNDNSVPVTLASGVNSTGNDFYDSALGVVGDRIWLDENSDGIQDAGEAGIANVRVLASNTVSGVTVTNWTDSSGTYLFTDLRAGTYVILVDTNTLAAGLAANQTFDPDGTTNQQTTVTLAGGQEILTADFGYNWAPRANVQGNTGMGAIGDRVWIDANGNGLQDAGEPGMGGIPVRLVNVGADGIAGTADDTTNTTTTAADGSYIFTGLSAGAYVVTVNGGVAPTNYTATGDPDGVLDNKTTTPILLAPGDVYVNADFGYKPNTGYGATIGDLVWFDANANGVTNSQEYGIAGVTVALIRDSNSNGVWDAGEPIIASTVTGTNGAYAFTGVPVSSGGSTNNYLVWVNDTAGVLIGLTPTYDNNGTGTPNISSVTNLTSAGNLLQDFGYTAAGQTAGAGLIGDTIYLDRNTNGVFEAGEGLEGVTVRLYDTNGVLLAVTATDENGHYAFGGLSTNGVSYTVKVDTNTLPGTLGKLTNTVYPAGGSANQSTVTLTGATPVNLAQDFGYAATVPNAILGTIWEDLNANGVLAAGETGRYAGVTVALLDTNGNIVATTVTGADGAYAFLGLPDGRFTVDVTDSGMVLNGTWHSLGTNGVAGNSQTDPYTLTVGPGTTNTVDFGYWRAGGALGNRVWWDSNNDNLQTPGEVGMGYVKVTLTVTYAGGPTNRAVVLTDTNGFYNFQNLLLDEGLPASGAGAPVYVLSVTVTQSVYTADIPNSGSNMWLDSDTHGGTTGVAVRGVVNMALQANPTNEPAAASYDFGYKVKPTLARVTGFGAFSRDGVVIARWETAEERDTLGFWLERWEDGEYLRVNTALIPGRIYSVDGAVYEQLDAGAKPGRRYTYRLIEVETTGELRYLGPYTVTVDGETLSFDEWSRTVFDVGQQMNQSVSGLEADPDGDGMNNFAEFIAGTDPADKNSALRIQGVEQGVEGVVVRWQSASNRSYSIEMSTNLEQGYQPVATGVLATPPVNAQVCPVETMPPTLFFRVITP